MRAWRWILATLLVTAVAATPATASPRRTVTVAPQTQGNLTAAAHGEAFAHAKYWAYAQEAEDAGYPEISRVFLRTSRQEFGDHFLKLAALAGLVGDNAANLRDAIAGENSEATSVYPGFAAQARAQGGDAADAAAGMWDELAGDEAGHRDAFIDALQAITDPASGARVPRGPSVDPYPVAAGEPQVHGVTLENLFATLHGESFANAKYTAYGLHARQTGERRLARLWARTADIELLEHFAETATRAGLVRDTASNLRDAITGEIDEATNVYLGYAREARSDGDEQAAELFGELAGDEAHHAMRFIRALQDLELSH